MYYPVKIGANIRALRNAKGLSQEKLAELADMGVAWLRESEHDCANVTRDVLDRIACALDVPVWALYLLKTDPDVIRWELREIQKRLTSESEAVLV